MKPTTSPFPVPLSEDDLDDLYGQELELKAVFTSRGEAASMTLRVVVIEG